MSGSWGFKEAYGWPLQEKLGPALRTIPAPIMDILRICSGIVMGILNMRGGFVINRGKGLVLSRGSLLAWYTAQGTIDNIAYCWPHATLNT